MKNLLTRSVLCFLFLSPIATFAAGDENILDYFGGMPNAENIEVIAPSEVDMEIQRQIDALSEDLYTILNSIWSSSENVYDKKQKELAPKIEKIRFDFVDPAYQALSSGDSESAKDLLSQGTKSAKELKEEVQKWAFDQEKENNFLSLEQSMNDAKNMRSDMALIMDHFSDEFSPAEKKKIVRLEKLANYYEARIFREYEKAKRNISESKPGDDFWKFVSPVDSWKYRLEGIYTRFENILLGE